MSPYIVTVRTPVRLPQDKGDELGRQSVTRHAVGTFDEAQRIAEDVITELAAGEAYDRALDQIEDMPEQGGVVGPLTDRTVIEVERRRSVGHFDRIGLPPLERIEAVMDDLWKRADINDTPVTVRGHDFGCWANDLGIALQELQSSAAVANPAAESPASGRSESLMPGNPSSRSEA